MSHEHNFKKFVANQLLRKGSLFIHLDPRVEGVVVPPWLRHQAQLVLQVGLDMPIPIPDLLVTDVGISGTLSFARTPYFCSLPWESVFALVGDDAKGMVFDESMPPEVKDEAAAAAKQTKKSDVVRVVEPKKPRPNYLRLVK